jgi:hypothetical protein
MCRQAVGSALTADDHGLVSDGPGSRNLHASRITPDRPAVVAASSNPALPASWNRERATGSLGVKDDLVSAGATLGG